MGPLTHRFINIGYTLSDMGRQSKREESDDSQLEDFFEEISGMDSKSIFKPSTLVLVLSNSENKGPNVMTAAWWMLAGYNPLRYLLSVDHKTYTYEIIEENQQFVLSAPTRDMIDAVTLCGKVSGREIDKIDHLDLKTLSASEIDVPILQNAVGNVECEVMESFDFKGCTYYFGSVEKAYVSKDDLNGRILSGDAEPLGFMGSDWESKEENDTKHRYYLQFDDENVQSFPGDKVIEDLPSELQEKYTD